MKKLNLVFILFLLQGIVYGQIQWLNDFKTAQVHSLSQGKLIVMDFWASWCGPCRMMDEDLWSRKDVIALSQNFVSLRVDVDSDPNLAQQYRANAIPKVVIVDLAGNIIWEQLGYRSSNIYLDVLNNLPSHLEDLNKNILPFIREDDQMTDHLTLAFAYQQIGKETRHSLLKSSFFSLSTNYFKHVAKKSDDVAMQETASLHLLLNDAYDGHSKRALKRLEKLDNLTADESTDLKKFIQAYCYQCEGQSQAVEALRQEIENEAYLAELENKP